MANTGLFLVAFCLILKEISGHGMVLDPPNRSSLWRFDKSAPINWDDDQNYCGSFGTQWDKYGGKCGLCGDSYGAAHPQPNENTGTYGQGKVVATYQSGSVIDVKVKLTTNHLGYFNYSICVLQNPNAPESGEECFKELLFEDGSNKYNLQPGESDIVNRVRLPSELTCDRCVLRWHYNTASNWGKCEDGTSAMGCGPQETYRTCSDIAIH